MAFSSTTNSVWVRDGRILKVNTFKGSGGRDSFSQYLYNNTHVKYHRVDSVPFYNFDIPRYSAITCGTLDFTTQNQFSIYAIDGNPALRFSFSANASVFATSGYSKMVNDIYKIPYSDVLEFRRSGSVASWNKISDQIQSPTYSYTASTAQTILATSTTVGYTFSPNQLDAEMVSIGEDVLEDRAMYLFNFRHYYSQGLSAYTNTVDLNQNRFTYDRTAYLSSAGDETLISAGPWSGLTAKGMYFTAFSPPGKPVIEDPRPEAQSAETFTPVFTFSNVEDGDQFVVDVTYSMGNSGFTVSSAVTQYFGLKTERNVETTNFTEMARRITVPIQANSPYWYRVGNVKYIDNIFGIRQYIATYTAPHSALTTANRVVTVVANPSAKKKLAP